MRTWFTLCFALVIAGTSAVQVLAAHADDDWLGDGDEIVLFYECVDSCGIPPDWTVIRDVNDTDSWGDFPCGEGLNNCPPGDPSGGWSFVCRTSYQHYYGPMDEWLVSPDIDVSGCTSLTLRFVHLSFYLMFFTAPNEVRVRVDDGPFQQMWLMYAGAPYVDGIVYDEEIDLNEFVGNHTISVAFRFQSYHPWNSENWWVDDVEVVGQLPTLAEPRSWGAIKSLYRP